MNKIWKQYNSFISRILRGAPLNWRIDPNYITVSRLFLVYFALFAFPQMNPWIALFAAAAAFTITDYLDGACARAWGKATIGGKLLDPIIDKTSLLWFLLFLYMQSIIPHILLLIILFSELIIIIITIYWIHESWVATRFADDPFSSFLGMLDKKIPIHPAGKIKIVMFCISFTILALAGIINNADLAIAGIVFSALGVIFTALSIPKYLNPPN